MDATQLLESFFDFCYAKEIINKMYAVFKKNCSGCQQGLLSQRDHICLSLTECDLLEMYFDQILLEVNETDVLRYWESTVTVMQDDFSPELVYMYKLKIDCRDWRETDMKTSEWKSKMKRLTRQLIRSKNSV